MGAMTTLTDRRTFEVRPIPPEVVRELLVRDDAGHPPRLQADADGGSPLRCCLRPARPGELTALVSYAPLRRWARQTGADPGPYDEAGPVFVHAPGEPCAGPAGTGYPGWAARGNRVLRAYDASGCIIGGRLVPADPDGSPASAEQALAELLGDPEVALVHARAVEFGCFTFEVRRASSLAGRSCTGSS